MKWYWPGAAFSAALVGVMVSASPVAAADLGGNCCADLEERIAYLESSVAQKGNRRVSLKISGWVSEQVMYWDDGVESNVYVQSLGTAFASNFNFTGKAQITKDLSAGYVLHVEAITSDTYTTSQDRPVGPGVFSGVPNSLQVVYSYWYLQSEQYGRVSVGQLSPADDSAVVALDSSGTLPAAYWVAYDVFGFKVRGNFAAGDSLIWGNAGSCRGYGGGPGDCNGVPLNVVRYDTPTLHGFSASASWGDDDNIAFAGRYINTHNDFTLKGVVTYSETTNSAKGAPPQGNLKYVQASIYTQHNPSGWFAQGVWARLDQSPNPQNNPVTNTWYFKSGVRLGLTSIGKTIPYGEVLKAYDGALLINDGGTPLNPLDDTARVLKGSETTFWGFGVVQEIDAAAMSVWLRYRDHDVDLPGIETKGLSTVVFGAFINF